jgi:nitrogen-specific signal transduction histidine kinase
MVPKIVLHKKNGHHHVPAADPPSLGELMREVHTAGAAEPRATYDVLKFATVVRTEKRTALLEQAMQHVDGQQAALGGLLARTEAALARGELQDVRGTLEALKAQAGGATQLFARLLASAETRVSQHGLVGINDVIADAAERAGAGTGMPVVTRLDPAAPMIVGNAARLQRALISFVVALASRPVSIDVAQADGVIQGEMVARITVTGGSPLPSAAAALGGPARLAEPVVDTLGVHLARQIVAEHGGVVSLTSDADGRGVIRIELPEV